MVVISCLRDSLSGSHLIDGVQIIKSVCLRIK